jgi:hypothetical protein
MLWASILDGFPEEGLECLLSCLQADGSFVELIGYRRDGEWVIETEDPEQRHAQVRHWMPLVSARKIV